MKYQFTLHECQAAAHQGFFKFDRYTVSFEKFEGGFIEKVHRECGKKGDIVAVLPYDPKREEFLLIEQFRIGMAVRGIHPWTMEIVAGFMDVPGEEYADTARRELLEETGCHAHAVYPLVKYYSSPGGSASQVHVFVAIVNAEEAAEHCGIEEEGENIRVHRLPFASLRDDMAAQGIDNATAIIAFQQFFSDDWYGKLK